jgi:hypothetical protein
MCNSAFSHACPLTCYAQAFCLPNNPPVAPGYSCDEAAHVCKIDKTSKADKASCEEVCT